MFGPSKCTTIRQFIAMPSTRRLRAAICVLCATIRLTVPIAVAVHVVTEAIVVFVAFVLSAKSVGEA